MDYTRNWTSVAIVRVGCAFLFQAADIFLSTVLLVAGFMHGLVYQYRGEVVRPIFPIEQCSICFITLKRDSGDEIKGYVVGENTSQIFVVDIIRLGGYAGIGKLTLPVPIDRIDG